MNKGQITIFIIIGLFILIIFITLQTYTRLDIPKSDSEILATKQYAQTCLENSAKTTPESFFTILPVNTIIIDEGKTLRYIPILLEQNQNLLPQQIEPTIQTFANTIQTQCLNLLQTPATLLTKPQTTVKLLDDTTIFTSHQKISITKPASQTLITEPFTYNAQYRLKTILTTAHQIINQIKQKPTRIPLGLMISQLEQHNLNITYRRLIQENTIKNNILLFTIIDNNTRFDFATKTT